jgi:hypothetical protein
MICSCRIWSIAAASAGEDAEAAAIDQILQEQIIKSRPTPIRYEPQEINYSASSPSSFSEDLAFLRGPFRLPLAALAALAEGLGYSLRAPGDQLLYLERDLAFNSHRRELALGCCL